MSRWRASEISQVGDHEAGGIAEGAGWRPATLALMLVKSRATTMAPTPSSISCRMARLLAMARLGPVVVHRQKAAEGEGRCAESLEGPQAARLTPSRLTSRARVRSCRGR